MPTVMMEATTMFSNLSSNSTTAYVKVYTDAWVVMSGVILFIFLIFGVLANSITLAVIRNSKILKNGYYVVLGSLCMSDLVSAFISILFWYRRTLGYEFFKWPLFFCKLYWAMDMWTTFSTAYHILTFAVLRFTAVKFPIIFKKISNRRHIKWVVAGIWFFTFCLGAVPHYIFNTVHSEDRLTDIHLSRWASCSLDPYWIPTWKIYVEYAYIFFIYIPAGGVLVLTIAIIVVLQQRKKNEQQMKGTPSRRMNNFKSQDEPSVVITSDQHVVVVVVKKKRKKTLRPSRNQNAALQLLLIVGSFLFGYVPLTIYHFGLHQPAGSREINTYEWKFAMVQYLMLRFSECLNPVFYNIASRKMRRETRHFLGKLTKRFETTRSRSMSVGSMSNDREL